MALQTTTYLSGKINNIVFYKRSGIYIARSIPEKVRQSPATMQRSINFGIASGAGRAMRQLLSNAIAFPKDKIMQRRFSGAIAQWLALNSVEGLAPVARLPFVSDFSFSGQTCIAERFKIPIAVSSPAANQIEVRIPPFVPTIDISAAAYTGVVACTITAASCRLKDAAIINNFTVRFNIPYTDTLTNEQVLLFPVDTGPGSLVITAMMMSYKLADNETDMRPCFMPSSIIDARYC